MKRLIKVGALCKSEMKKNMKFQNQPKYSGSDITNDGRSESTSRKTSWVFANPFIIRATLSFHQSVFHPPLELTRTRRNTLPVSLSIFLFMFISTLSQDDWITKLTPLNCHFWLISFQLTNNCFHTFFVQWSPKECEHCGQLGPVSSLIQYQ